jgi:hypothetical protein
MPWICAQRFEVGLTRLCHVLYWIQYTVKNFVFMFKKIIFLFTSWKLHLEPC